MKKITAVTGLIIVCLVLICILIAITFLMIGVMVALASVLYLIFEHHGVKHEMSVLLGGTISVASVLFFLYLPDLIKKERR